MTKLRLLNSNILKIIALITMTIDHVGLILFPDVEILRVIGRIAFPIFAFFIAEGCKYTKNKLKYFLIIFLLGLFCQFLISPFLNFYHLNILITFSFSILLIYIFEALKRAIFTKNKKLITVFSCLITIYISIIIVLFFPYINLIPFTIDYGFFGILLPLFTYAFNNHLLKIISFSSCLILICVFSNLAQWFSLLSIQLLLCYNGQRGKIKLKYLFYIYYPLHLIILLIM